MGTRGRKSRKRETTNDSIAFLLRDRHWPQSFGLSTLDEIAPGLAAEVTAAGRVIDTIHLTNPAGETKLKLRMDVLAELLGYPFVGITRYNLQRVLLQRLSDGDVVLGHRLEALHTSDPVDAKTLEFKGIAQPVRARVVIGADGRRYGYRSSPMECFRISPVGDLCAWVCQASLKKKRKKKCLRRASWRLFQEKPWPNHRTPTGLTRGASGGISVARNCWSLQRQPQKRVRRTPPSPLLPRPARTGLQSARGCCPKTSARIGGSSLRGLWRACPSRQHLPGNFAWPTARARPSTTGRWVPVLQ